WQYIVTSPVHCASHCVVQQKSSAAQTACAHASHEASSAAPATQVSCAQALDDMPELPSSVCDSFSNILRSESGGASSAPASFDPSFGMFSNMPSFAALSAAWY